MHPAVAERLVKAVAEDRFSPEEKHAIHTIQLFWRISAPRRQEYRRGRHARTRTQHEHARTRSQHSHASNTRPIA
eukprot:190425-Pleurochrysis_carterae.AAC.1